MVVNVPVNLWPAWFRQVLARLLRRPVPLRQDGARVLLEHLTTCHPVGAVIAIDGNGDDMVARMLAAGWTWTPGTQTELVAGKRVRYLTPPENLVDEQIRRALAGEE